MKKAGRNDPCPCGSGKKYKKCCELKDTSHKFHAEVITPAANAPGAQQANKVSSFFQRNLPPPPALAPKPETHDEEKLPM